jgi:ribonuclease G
MTKEIIINATNEETRIAIVEDAKLVELFVERPEYERMVGDIYLGKINRVLPGMQAAFVDIGLAQNAFLHFSDATDSPIDDEVDYEDRNKHRRSREKKDYSDVAKRLKNNNDILVQIIKEPINTKGSRITSEVSLPGRFIVLIPGKKHIGISKKISGQKERKRLRQLVQSLLPDNFGVIIRTVADGKKERELKKDITTLLKTWKKIESKLKNEQSPAIIHKDMAMASSIIRDLFTVDVERVVVDSRRLMREISAYVKDVAPHLAHKVEYYKSPKPIFDEMKIEADIEKMGSHKVWFKHGGYLIIEPTEALVSIDVNSGKFIGKKDHESNSLKVNMEAAREIARQTRLRDLGGIIVVDFIDMTNEENKRKVFMVLKKEFSKNRSITKIEELSRFGLIEMTRQRVRPNVLQTINNPCPVCNGTGLVPTLNSTVSAIERWIQRYRSGRGDRRVSIRLTEDVYKYMTDKKAKRRLKLMWKYWMKINLYKDETLDIGEFAVYDRLNKSAINNKKILTTNR